MRIVGVIQARMESTRLPGKVLLEACGRPVLAHVVARVRALRGLSDVVVATTKNPADDAIVELCGALKVSVVRGYQVLPDGRNDVLSRVAMAARIMKADTIVRVTADCPLWCPELGSEVVGEFIGGDYDYVSNVNPKLDGFDTQVFSMELLERADREATDPEDRHHVCPWMHRQPWGQWVNQLTKVGSYKLSLDTQEDWRLIRGILSRVKMFDWRETLAACEAEELLRTR